jgi:hypothetical protein
MAPTKKGIGEMTALCLTSLFVCMFGAHGSDALFNKIQERDLSEEARQACLK